MSSNKKSIVLMLDIGNTLDGMTVNGAKRFVDIINHFRIFYEADLAFIFISTHDNNTDNIKYYLDIISKHVTNSINIGTSFYLNGIYNYNDNKTIFIENNYNYDKLEIFENNYLENNEYEVLWCGICDDYIKYDYIYNFNYSSYITIFRPSQISPRSIMEDNFMCYSTYTRSFDGILELLERKLNYIKNKKFDSLFYEEIENLFSLNWKLILELLKDMKFDLILKYIDNEKINSCYYINIKSFLNHKLNDESFYTADQLVKMTEIINLIDSKFSFQKVLSKK